MNNTRNYLMVLLHNLNPYDNIKRYAKAQWIFHEKFGKPITHAWKFKSVMFGKKSLTELTQKEWNELLEVLTDEYKRLTGKHI